jgi:hypothetical protein
MTILVRNTLDIYASIGAPIGNRRYYYDFNGVNNFILFPSLISVTDFEFEFTGELSSNGFYLLADNTVDNMRLLITSTGSVFVNAGSIGTLSNPSLLDDMEHLVVIRRVSGNFTVTIDGVLQLQVTETSTLQFNTIGSQQSGPTGVPFFEGRLWNARLWEGGDRTTGTLTVQMAVNDNQATISNSANPLFNGTLANVDPLRWVFL